MTGTASVRLAGRRALDALVWGYRIGSANAATGARAAKRSESEGSGADLAELRWAPSEPESRCRWSGCSTGCKLPLNCEVS